MKKKRIFIFFAIVFTISFIFFVFLKLYLSSNNGELKESMVSNIMVTINNEDTQMIFIFTFDNNDICLGWKWYQKESTEDKLEEVYNNLLNFYNKEANNYTITSISNIQLQNGFITYDRNQWNGHTKEEVKQYIKDNNWNNIEF